jgi:hypothetical protein
MKLRLSNQRFWCTVLATLVILSLLNVPARSQAVGYTENILWNFPTSYNGINYTVAGLIMDTSGNLYGTTQLGGTGGSTAGGTAYELTPEGVESVLWNFGSNPSDGYRPVGGVIMDAGGNLYGTTLCGGVYANSATFDDCGGTVYQLTPPATIGGNWTESILWSFGNGSDGSNPDDGLIIDKSGNLYGTTYEGGAYANGEGTGGTVFKLAPPTTLGGNWTESILWSFGNANGAYQPYAGLLMDKSGNLYGTTYVGGVYGDINSGGTVFELTPPSTVGGDWTGSILWSFGNGNDGYFPVGGVIMDTGGNLYGTTGLGGAFTLGTTFELAAPSTSGGKWTESILWNFGNGADGSGPAGLIMDTGGALYGTTHAGGPFDTEQFFYSGGTAFKLTPPSTSGDNWTESILWGFNHGSDAYNPSSGLIADNSGNFYGTTDSGGANTVGGTVFELSPGGPPTPTPIFTPTPTTGLTASPGTVNFGNVAVTGTSKPKKVTLINKGTAPAQIANVTRLAPFMIASSGNSCTGRTIAPKKTCSFEVEFAPQTLGPATGSFYVIYNGTSPTGPLTGNGAAVTLKAPKSLSLPPQSAGSIGKPKSLVILNPSTVTVAFGRATVGGSAPGSFQIAGDQCLGQALAPKGKCGIGIEFSPSGNTSGTQSATLSLGFAYGANNGEVSVNLSGKVK